MTTQDKDLRTVREALAEESRRLDEAQKDLERRKLSFKRALGEYRSACGHAEIVEFRMPPPEPGVEGTAAAGTGRNRFCLGCGITERGPRTFSYLTAEPKAILPPEDFERMRSRLYGKARFDEFDADGAWRGEKDDEHIRKGMD